MGSVHSQFFSRSLVGFCLLLIVVSCGGSGDDGPLPNPDQSPQVSDTPQHLDKLSPLSEEEYAGLDPYQQYQVANKLLSTLFDGIAVDDFFDISAGMSTPALKAGAGFLTKTRQDIETRLTPEVEYDYQVISFGHDDVVDAKDVPGVYALSQSNQGMGFEVPLMKMTLYPLSQDRFEMWVAYVLSNTEFFSPAAELISTDETDAVKVFNKLLSDFRQGKSLRDIVYRHLNTQENWRRFPSPEINAREVLDLYLGHQPKESDVIGAAIACKDLYIADETYGFELLSTRLFNVEAQTVLGESIVTCADFYQLVSMHSDLVNNITSKLVDYFFETHSAADKSKFVDDIVSSNPQTFQEIFKSILFSREYLLNTERFKSFEENFIGTARRMKWEPYRQFIQDLTTPDEFEILSMHHMSWASMTYKYGRESSPPTDALSFANYHRAIRDVLFLDSGYGDTCALNRCKSCGVARCKWKYGLGLYPAYQPSPAPVDATVEQLAMYNYELDNYNAYTETLQRVHALSLHDYIDYLFVTVLGRTAVDVEKNDLIIIFENSGFIETVDGVKQLRAGAWEEVAQICFDYVSRLHEAYYFMKLH